MSNETKDEPAFNIRGAVGAAMAGSTNTAHITQSQGPDSAPARAAFRRSIDDFANVAAREGPPGAYASATDDEIRDPFPPDALACGCTPPAFCPLCADAPPNDPGAIIVRCPSEAAEMLRALAGPEATDDAGAQTRRPAALRAWSPAAPPLERQRDALTFRLQQMGTGGHGIFGHANVVCAPEDPPGSVTAPADVRFRINDGELLTLDATLDRLVQLEGASS